MRSSKPADPASSSAVPTRIFRIARSAHSATFPPPAGVGRFDDPDRNYRVLYAALDRRGAFAESLQVFRPDLATRTALLNLRYGAMPTADARLASWAESRTLTMYRLPQSARLFDLRTAAAMEQVANELAVELRHAGTEDFDVSTVTGANRNITQLISRWLYASDHDGILFPSRLGTEWTNCAVFDRIKPRVVRRTSIEIDDPDLIAVAKAFGITVNG